MKTETIITFSFLAASLLLMIVQLIDFIRSYRRNKRIEKIIDDQRMEWEAIKKGLTKNLN